MPSALGWARRDWSLDGSVQTVKRGFEGLVNGTSGGGGAALLPSVETNDRMYVLRGGWRSPDRNGPWVQLTAMARRVNESGERITTAGSFPVDTVDTLASRPQYVAAAVPCQPLPPSPAQRLLSRVDPEPRPVEQDEEPRGWLEFLWGTDRERPVAVAHSELLLAGNENAAVLQADLRRPDDILQAPQLRRLLDLDRPIGVLMVAVLHFVSEEDGPEEILRRFR